MGGTIKISGLPENVSKKSVNFGPGLDLLMNPNRHSRPNSPSSDIKLTDISDLDNSLKSTLKSPTEMRNKVFGGGFTPTITPVKVTGNLRETVHVKLGEDSSKLNEKGMPQFNEIPINPEVKVEKPTLSNDDLLKQKFIFIRKLDALEKQGISLSKKYTMDDSLDEMKGEFEMIKGEREKKSSVKFQGKMGMACVSGLEFLNQKFDPFDIKLDGWAESIHENVGDYDDVFGELHEKYGSKATMAPELKLLFMLGGSGVMLHMTNTMFKSAMPGMDDIMRQNPELMQQFTQAAASSMGESNPGLGGFMNMVGGNMQQMQPPRGSPPGPNEGMRIDPPQMQQSSRPDIDMARSNTRASFNDAENMESNFASVNEKKKEMRGPSDLRDILSGLKTKSINLKENKPGSTVSIDELNDMKSSMKKPKKSKRKIE